MAVSATDIDQNLKIDEDLAELAALLGGTLRGLKHSNPPLPALRDAAARGSLGPRHMPALISLALAGPLGVSELSRRLGLGLSTTSAIVGELSRAGLVERAEDDADRRRTIVRLHDDYRDVLVERTAIALAPLRRTLDRLSAQAREHFMEGWRILHEEATGETSPGTGRGNA